MKTNINEMTSLEKLENIHAYITGFLRIGHQELEKAFYAIKYVDQDIFIYNKALARIVFKKMNEQVDWKLQQYIKHTKR